MGTRSEQKLFQRGDADGQQTEEKMLNITDYQGNANQNHKDTSPYMCQDGCHQKKHHKCWRGCAEKGILIHCLWECKLR